MIEAYGRKNLENHFFNYKKKWIITGIISIFVHEAYVKLVYIGTPTFVELKVNNCTDICFSILLFMAVQSVFTVVYAKIW